MFFFVTAQTLRIINVSPNVLGQEENVDELMDDDNMRDEENFVSRCQMKINAGMQNCFM